MVKNNFMKNKKGATGLRPAITSVLLVVLFIIFIMVFVVSYLNNTNPQSNAFMTKYNLSGSVTALNNTVNDMITTSQNVQDKLGAAKPNPVGFIFLIFEAAFYIPWTFLKVIGSALVLIPTILFPSLKGTALGGILNIVLGSMIAMMIITFVLLIVKAIRTGESER